MLQIVMQLFFFVIVSDLVPQIFSWEHGMRRNRGPRTWKKLGTLGFRCHRGKHRSVAALLLILFLLHALGFRVRWRLPHRKWVCGCASSLQNAMPSCQFV